ncbi:MAG: hypothetical protein HY046_06600 [Acidobacteria bacterium]|nr:hypothetical protein [Acidobacteriota bacterium]
MRYETKYERFQAPGPDGTPHTVEFRKGGFLSAGDQPELFFFHVNGIEVVVGVSGNGLREMQSAQRYLSREEKIDLAGLLLKQRIQEGAALVSENLYVDSKSLATLARELGLGE